MTLPVPHAPDLQFERTVRNAPGVIRAAQLETDTVAALFVHGERLVGLLSKRARLCELDPRARSGRALPLEVDREVRDCLQVRGQSKADRIAAILAADEAAGGPPAVRCTISQSRLTRPADVV